MRNIAIIAAITLTACTSGKLVNGDLDREGEWLKVKVERVNPDMWAQSQNSLKADKQGQAVYYLNDPHNECVITVISRGKGVMDGKYTLTLGHELMHCLYGDYHD